jgi:hypothetical protein
VPSYNPRTRRFPPPWTAEDNRTYEPEPRDGHLCVLPMVDLPRRLLKRSTGKLLAFSLPRQLSPGSRSGPDRLAEWSADVVKGIVGDGHTRCTGRRATKGMRTSRAWQERHAAIGGIRINNQRDRLDDDSLQPCRYWASSSRSRETMFGAEFHDASRSSFQGIRSASQDEFAATAITGALCVVTPSSRRCLTQKSSSTVQNIGC